MGKVIISETILGKNFLQVLNREITTCCKEYDLNEKNIIAEIRSIKYEEDFLEIFNKYFKNKLILKLSEKE